LRVGEKDSASQAEAHRPPQAASRGEALSGLSHQLDLVDAALCALTAHHLLAGTFKAYGDATEGAIVVAKI
jgi:predicted RNase H-like nuclease